MSVCLRPTWFLRRSRVGSQFLLSPYGCRTIAAVILIAVTAVGALPADARHDDLTLRVHRWSASDAELPLRRFRRQLDPAPSSYWEFDRRADRQRSFRQSGGDQLVIAPSATSWSAAIHVEAATHVETEPVSSAGDSNSSAAMAGSAPLTLTNSTTLSTSSPAKQLPPLPGIWFIVAAILLLAAPGTAVLWFFGLAAFLVGSISLLRDLSWQSQLITFAVSGIAAVMLWQRLDRPSRDGTDVTDQLFGGRGPYAFVGHVFKLQQPIVDGFGMVTIGGIVWRVAGNDCAAGKRVRVVRAEGTLLIVDSLET